MKLRSLIVLAALLTGLGTPVLRAGEFHFTAGLSYVDGIHNAVDDLEDLYHQAGFSLDDSYTVPISVSFQGYYEWDNGLGLGASVGPTLFLAIEEDFGFDEEEHFSSVVPIGLDVRYTLFRDRDVAPYVRAGVHYPLVSGHNLDSSEVGAFGAVGIELYRNRKVSFGFEVSYDSSTIKVQGPTGATKETTYPGFMFSAFVRF